MLITRKDEKKYARKSTVSAMHRGLHMRTQPTDPRKEFKKSLRIPRRGLLTSKNQAVYDLFGPRKAITAETKTVLKPKSQMHITSKIGDVAKTTYNL